MLYKLLPTNKELSVDPELLIFYKSFDYIQLRSRQITAALIRKYKKVIPKTRGDNIIRSIDHKHTPELKIFWNGGK